MEQLLNSGETSTQLDRSCDPHEPHQSEHAESSGPQLWGLGFAESYALRVVVLTEFRARGCKTVPLSTLCPTALLLLSWSGAVLVARSDRSSRSSEGVRDYSLRTFRDVHGA